ncbi:unnamed protein product [Kuraishia capsulata CBS 1993]|uniref:PRELI/MSF1 domain-containing protein n=1 Tax=Kuraishia capsulata CBS 1993 TaxID=1382522 RepID=W6MQV9_9ASCO|nr:uncharacterized protein KUCA_T00003621001 [Kuraishia capsulata CBS 1993]CDK27642.1 unnamed protein product [Kuraishia capsulata CBS 1993]
MKLFSSEHQFAYPWEQVTAANWLKYPNEVSTHVIGVDVLRREVDPSSGILTTERLLTCEQAIPGWLRHLVGGASRSYVREISLVDPKQKTLTMRSCNLTMCNLLRVHETCIYSPATDGSSTTFTQTAEITAYASWKKICDKIEDWSVERFGQNAIKGRTGFEGVLQLFSKIQEGGKLIDEVAGKGGKLIDEVTDKTSIVLSEVTDKTSSVLSEVTENVKRSIFKP